ncbi:hypothetical protein KIPB_016908, partial [Kipferlia bialata]|eukprot:g16908.t1
MFHVPLSPSSVKAEAEAESEGEREGLPIWGYLQGNHALKAISEEGALTISPVPKYPLYLLNIDTDDVSEAEGERDVQWRVTGSYTDEDIAR